MANDRRIAERLLDKLGERIVAFRRVPGAFNCTAYAAQTRNNRKYLVKRYKIKKNDKRNRLATEFGGLSFLWRNGIRNIPRPVAIDRTNRMAAYSFIDGKKLKGKAIKLKDAMDSAKIIGQMAGLSGKKRALSQPTASEACFSIKAYIDIVEQRMASLERAKEKGVLEFVSRELNPFFRDVKDFVKESSSLFGVNISRKLSKREMLISPSDVGFHNILKDRAGKIFFIDFEYYGWDDPAKTISDFFLQPDAPLPLKLRRPFYGKVMGYLGNDIDIASRLPVVYAILSVKWCQIMLNAFLGNPPSHDRIVLARQLEKARRKLRQAKQELSSLAFPLSLVKEAAI